LKKKKKTVKTGQGEKEKFPLIRRSPDFTRPPSHLPTGSAIRKDRPGLQPAPSFDGRFWPSVAGTHRLTINHHHGRFLAGRIFRICYKGRHAKLLQTIEETLQGLKVSAMADPISPRHLNYVTERPKGFCRTTVGCRGFLRPKGFGDIRPGSNDPGRLRRPLPKPR